MKGMNLSKLKKVSSDNSCTTFQHEDGHSVRIAHKSLDKKMREKLDALPLHKASGGAVKQYAEGTGDVESSDGAPPINININGQPAQNASQMPAAWSPDQYKPDPKIMEAHERLRQYYSNMPGGQLAGSADDRASSDLQSLNEYKENPDSFSSSSAGRMKDVAAIANPDASASVAGQQGQPQAPAEQAPPQDQGQDQGLAAQEGAPEEQDQNEAPEQQEAPARAPAAEDMASAAPQEAGQKTPQQIYQDNYMRTYKEVTTENAAIEHDLKNGKITPETYKDLFANKSTLGKIGMIFGVLASGAGAGITHQPSALLELMNNQIKNDNESQQRSQENAQNLIKINQNRLANEAGSNLTEVQAENHAREMSLMQKNLFAMDHLTRMTQNLPAGSPQRVQAERALGLMYQGMTAENSTVAARMAAANAWYNTMQGMNGGNQTGGDEGNFQSRTNTMRMMGPQGEMMAKNLEEKHFPGLKGQASVPLSSGDRDSINSGIAFDQKLHRFIDWTQKHSGDLRPADMNQGRALAAELQGAYRMATHGGVYKEGEQNFISKLIDENPTKFFNSVRVVPQLKAIASENNQRINQLVKSKGFSGYDTPGTSSAPSSSGSENEIERLYPKSGRTFVYDAKTKKPLRRK